MPYTREEGGRLNNFASEPKVYKAEPPTKGQQKTYFVLGGAALILVVGLIAIAVYASSVS